MLIFKEKLPKSNRTAIIAKIEQVAKNLGIDPNWLMAVINFETAGSFSTSIQNPFSKATGLIQFMPDTARSLGTSIEALAQMDFSTQLDYVERYYRPYRSRINGFVDLYLATFFPLAIGKPDNWVLQTKTISAKKIADQNPVFNDGGKVTVGSIKKGLLSKIPAQYAVHLVGQNKEFIGLVVVVVLGIVFYKPIKKYVQQQFKKVA
ncbi:MAG: transglycosylase SLT domain-containing protein [Bacteroidota bacterium]